MSHSRVVVDTNVIVSALMLSSSTAMQALEIAREHGGILISSEVLSEMIDVLSRKRFDRYVSMETRENFLAGLATEAEMIEITEKISVCRDPKDDKFLELAVNGNAHYLITGDRDLLILHPFQGIAIVTPAVFIEDLKA